ncbi:MAG: PEP-CTERM sorting domain-containing protein [Phycisphaerae bacterium]
MKKLVAVCVLAVVVFASAPAGATILGTVNIQNHNNAISDTGTVWGGGLSGVTGRTGIYSWTNAGGTGLGTSVPNWGFCIELIQGPYTGWQDVISLDAAPMPAAYGTPMGTAKADLISELWGRHFAPAWTTGANTQMAEAFGAALWEIIYETDSTWDVTSGAGFHATNIEQAATANLWLAELDGTGPRAFVYATSSPNGQDFLVPEPATIAILSLGGLLLRRKHS